MYSTALNAKACTWMGSCNRGQYAATLGTPISNLVCEPCPDGYYLNLVSHRLASCNLQQMCLPGSYASLAGSHVRDRTCSPCAPGTYTNQNHTNTVCLPIKDCPSGYELAGTDVTATGEYREGSCKACTPGFYRIKRVTNRAQPCQPHNETKDVICAEGEYIKTPSTLEQIGCASCQGTDYGSLPVHAQSKCASVLDQVKSTAQATPPLSGGNDNTPSGTMPNIQWTQKNTALNTDLPTTSEPDSEESGGSDDSSASITTIVIVIIIVVVVIGIALFPAYVCWSKKKKSQTILGVMKKASAQSGNAPVVRHNPAHSHVQNPMYIRTAAQKPIHNPYPEADITLSNQMMYGEDGANSSA